MDVLKVDPEDPWGTTILGTVYGGPGGGTRVAAKGDCAYVTTVQHCQGGRLYVIDAADPAQPRVAGEIALTGDASAVAAAGGYAYVAQGCIDSGLQVVDASDPENPQMAGRVSTPGDCSGVAVSGIYAYISVQHSSFQVIDVSDPDDPHTVASLSVPVSGQVVVSGKYAYVGGLAVVDISNPLDPQVVAEVPMTTIGMFIAGGQLYVAGGGDLVVLDITDPTSPRILGALDLLSASSVFVARSYAYVSGGFGLMVVDVSNPKNPPLVGNADTPGQAHDVDVEGAYAFVADWSEGLQVIDVADPAAPARVASAATPGFADYVVARDGLIYLAMNGGYPWNPPGGLSIFDATDPLNPLEIGNVGLPDGARGLAVAGDYAYIAGEQDPVGYLSVIRVSDPGHPSVVGSLELSGCAVDLARSGSYVYLTLRTLYIPYVYSFQVIDVTDPQQPYVAGSLCLHLPISGYLAVSGDHAYVGGGPSFHVIDVSNPHAPQLVSTIASPSWADRGGVTVSEGIAYVSNRYCCEAIDVTDPTQPRVIGAVPGGRGGSAVSGGYLHSAVGVDGVMIYPVQCSPLSAIPSDAGQSPWQDLCALPNPAGGQTVIRLTLQNSGRVLASIYDVAGRRVRTLVDGLLGAGAHQLPWNGCSGAGIPVPEGIYFVRVSTAEGTEKIGRVVVVR